MNKPKCANPECDVDAIIMVGRKFYCGNCAIKVMKIKQEMEEEEISKRLTK